MQYIPEKCSLFKPYLHREHGWCMGTKPETVGILDMLTHQWQPELIAKVRQASDKDERSALKRQLWAISPSSIQEKGRGMQYVVEHNSLLQFDIDPKDNPILLESGGLQKVKECLVKIPYTVYCGLSSSGTGLWGFFRISHPHLHEQHFNAMEKAFDQIGIEIDPAPKSTASIRFVCHDPDAFYNDDPKIFDLRLEPVIKEKKSLSTESKSSDQSDGKDLIANFNANCTPDSIDEILTNFGFNYHSHQGKSYRYTRPGKDTKAGLSVDYHEDKRTLYCFSSEVPGLEHWKTDKAGWSCSPLTALRVYGFGMPSENDDAKREHWEKVFNYIKSTLL